MITFEKYVVSFIFMLGTTVLAESIDEYDKFTDSLIDLHNKYRGFGNVDLLIINETMSTEASTFLDEWDDSDESPTIENYQFNYFDGEFATSGEVLEDPSVVFIEWYGSLDDSENPKDTDSYKIVMSKDFKTVGVALKKKGNELRVVAIYK